MLDGRLVVVQCARATSPVIEPVPAHPCWSMMWAHLVQSCSLVRSGGFRCWRQEDPLRGQRRPGAEPHVGGGDLPARASARTHGDPSHEGFVFPPTNEVPCNSRPQGLLLWFSEDRLARVTGRHLAHSRGTA